MKTNKKETKKTTDQRDIDNNTLTQPIINTTNNINNNVNLKGTPLYKVNHSIYQKYTESPFNNQIMFYEENNNDTDSDHYYGDYKNNDDYDSEKDSNSVIIFDKEIHFLTDIKSIDIVFLIDTTQSMNKYLKSFKHFIRKLIKDAKQSLINYTTNILTFLRFGIVAYRDHDQENDSSSFLASVKCQLTSNESKFKSSLMDLNCQGGDDDAEAVLDGLDVVVNEIKWRKESFKLLYHILDDPAHEKELNGGVNDKYEGGCSCGKKYNKILYWIKSIGIDYKIVAANNTVKEKLKGMIDKFNAIINVDVLDAKIDIDINVECRQREDQEQEKVDNNGIKDEDQPISEHIEKESNVEERNDDDEDNYEGDFEEDDNY